MPQPVDTLDIWEDPHPGERMLVATNSLTGLHNCSQGLGGAGDTMSSVAAKARSMPQLNLSLAKRNVRLRQRVALKSIRIPAQIIEGPDSKRDTTFSPCTDKMAFSTMAPIQFLPGPDTLGPLEVDTDTETILSTETGTDIDGAWSHAPKASRRASCCLADLSNYLSVSHSEDDEDSAMKQLDSDPLSRESSCDADSYGWETEYDRQLDCRNTNVSRGRHRFGYRRT
ncbi:hypothetical protein GQX73_g8500 [Xylaria multiplex]|uniref:Uncharacterized protein n=1 Tax=Xylaria multiplex TaxID=323545 RepID=A0A7C8MHY3_9PEZI|nr:hypothetical protein GQX73_g8500 [Xylaria multiplex]